MTPCPSILVHECPDAPDGHRFIAGFYRPVMKDGETVGWSRLPMIISSGDRDKAISAARDFWAEEQAKIARRQANHAATSARRRGRSS